MSVLYVHTHAINVAKGMVRRYGGTQGALEECQRSIDSPLTTEDGKKFWNLVYIQLALMMDSVTRNHQGERQT